MYRRSLLVVLLVLCVFTVNGCSLVIQKGRRSDLNRIKELEQELAELQRAQNMLYQQLSQEIEDEKVRVEMMEKGLVITFVAEVLFDSGKDKLRGDSLSSLNKVAKILRDEVPYNNIGIEGHTDNVPIKHSKWKSNWELSSHRALSVLYFLVSKDINPARLSAIGYGEFQPVADNSNKAGRQLNRRVEIVILPRTTKTVGDVGYGYKEELK